MTLGLGMFGLYGLLRARTWGPLALGGAGAIALADGMGVFGDPTIGYLLMSTDGPMVYGYMGILAGACSSSRPSSRARCSASCEARKQAGVETTRGRHPCGGRRPFRMLPPWQR